MKFELLNYNWKIPFSNFLPGISGKFGKPSWCYYVSRNQCVISFGIRDKNHQIMEFLSFNKALEYVGLQGFRTFIKINGKIYEPFKKVISKNIFQKLVVSSHEIEIEEINKEIGLRINVLYYSVVKEKFPGLIRELRIENLNNRKLEIEIIDGLPKIYPYGVDMKTINTIARHIEGMMNVVSVKGIPLYRLKQTPQDIEKVGEITGGNFYLSFDSMDKKISHNNYIFDPEIVFNEKSIFDFPWNFREKINLKQQIATNRTPSAFTYKKINLSKNFSLYSLIGFVKKDEEIEEVVRRVKAKEFFKNNREENRKLIEGIKSKVLTLCNDKKFSEFSKQMFLDNVIRGGMPVVFDTKKDRSAFYLYSRQNGDLERDYHFFVLEPTYYSQGTGHYRSVNQNRRMDTFFFPEVEDLNIKTFMNLIQLDGYNPLEVTKLTYTLIDLKGFRREFSKILNKKELKELEKLVLKKFSPGEFLEKMEEFKRFKKENYEDLLKKVLKFSEENECGDIHEGFWVDHFFYNLDLIDSYLMIYPEKIKELFFGKNDYYFYDDPDVVKPRDEKFVFVGGKIRQYNSVYRDGEKIKLISERKMFPKRVRKNYGRGEIYYTNLFVKLLCIAANRMSSFDPFLVGLEMESDKPGWNDSMNGLPGMLGSSSCEAIELKRLIRILIKAIEEAEVKEIKVYEELADFVKKLNRYIRERLNSKSKNRNFIFWDKTHSLKEEYREKTKFGIKGDEKEIKIDKIKEFLNNCLKFFEKIVLGENKKRIFNKDGIPYTYFVNEVVEFEFIKDKKGKNKLSEAGYPLVRPKKFKQIPLPLFLEGAVHMLKVHPEYREKIYKAVKKSALFDRKLKMYKVCESLKDAPFEIGRVKAWGPGWIENESIYTHMEYKYLLEILRAGLFEEYFKDIKRAFTCYMKPEIYGRNIFENVSFIVSSSFPDKKMHGLGLQPRLSGVTGEMINMWVLMVSGKEPFSLKNGKLIFKLEPVLSKEMFLKKREIFRYIDEDEREKIIELDRGDFAFKLFGKILTIYKNPSLRNTFGGKGAKVVRYTIFYEDGKKEIIENSFVSEPFSRDIREGKVYKMEVELM